MELHQTCQATKRSPKIFYGKYLSEHPGFWGSDMMTIDNRVKASV
jgi:hypothetical protein